MTAEACAALVERGDPWRWRAAMAAPARGRGGLMALYALNLEAARAGFVTSEPMLGAIRLRWWADAVDEIFAGRPPRRHEVVEPLAEAIRSADLPRGPLDALIAAREWDCGREPFADLGALTAYLDATGGGLMWLAAKLLGAGLEAEEPARDLGRAGAAAAFLRAVPKLEALGRHPLPCPPEALAEAGLGWLGQARRGRGRLPGKVLPALLPAAGAGAVLKRALRRPEMVAAGELETSDLRARGAMLAMALIGRW